VATLADLTEVLTEADILDRESTPVEPNINHQRAIVPQSGTARAATPTVMDFFDLNELNDALFENDWSLREEIQVYRSIAQNPDARPRERMFAASELRKLATQLLSLHGVIRDLTLVGVDEKTGFRGIQSGPRLSHDQHTERLLKEMADSKEIIDAIPLKLEESYTQGDSSSSDFDETPGGFAKRPGDVRTFNPDAHDPDAEAVGESSGDNKHSNEAYQGDDRGREGPRQDEASQGNDGGANTHHHEGGCEVDERPSPSDDSSGEQDGPDVPATECEQVEGAES
jgi:hypothetical protein